MAAILVAQATVLRYALNPVLPPGYPFLTFFPAVVLTSFLAGWRPGAFAAVASGLISWWAFIPPQQSFAIDGRSAVALGFYVFVVVVDVALIWALDRNVQRLRKEEARSAELAATREILFHELQHRVSNNLQVVSAILQLERSKLSDPEARRALAESASRLALIGRIQRSLHDPERQSTEFEILAGSLSRDALEAAGANGVEVRVSGEASFAPDQVAPVALILLECVNNAVEHGFAGREGGLLEIRLERTGDVLRMTVRDDGAGPPEGFDPERRGGLGLSLAGQLARQLGGRFALFRADQGGAVGELTFPARSTS